MVGALPDGPRTGLAVPRHPQGHPRPRPTADRRHNAGADDLGPRHACAWTAAWLTVRGRTYLGPREILDDPNWTGKLDWRDRHSFKRSGHRPDLVGFLSGMAIAVEVELATKSKARLDAILKLHLGWLIARKTSGLLYVCGDEEGFRRIERAGQRVGLYRSDPHLRVELLDTIKAQTRAEFERGRAVGTAAA